MLRFHHFLPVWFLVFSLFLPRIALLIGWLDGWVLPLGQLGSALVWLLLPRVLVLLLIYDTQGLSLWFLIHLVVALVVWTGGTHRVSRSRRLRTA